MYVKFSTKGVYVHIYRYSIQDSRVISTADGGEDNTGPLSPPTVVSTKHTYSPASLSAAEAMKMLPDTLGSA